MVIQVNTSAIKPMAEWLKERKKNGIGDEKRLREILTLPDYKVEFERYASKSLPVCGISFEEAVDFFMNFDKKNFENERLQYKKESFNAFYSNMESRLNQIEELTALDEKDNEEIETLLKNGLPNETLNSSPRLTVILIISIGNSMGWPFGNYIDYDVANLQSFESKADFLHVTAHEIHHLFVGEMLFPDGIKGEDCFLQNFAYEGLAMHYNNNLATLYKEAKYIDRTYCADVEDMEFYSAHFDEIFAMIKQDYNACKNKSVDEVSSLVSEHYEQFTFLKKSIKQYPTYYFGCYMFGLVDLHCGKEKLYESILKPELFVKLYNSVAAPKYRL